MRLICALGLMLIMAGCQSRSDFGKCVGINDKRDPALEYRASTRNIILGVVFIETVVAPIIIALDELYCPVGPAVK